MAPHRSGAKDAYNADRDTITFLLIALRIKQFTISACNNLFSWIISLFHYSNRKEESKKALFFYQKSRLLKRLMKMH